ncbi:ferritin-like domain-containing protein [Nocardioides sp. CER19]|uniref:ferritin-like domain-containing protein n=1 Tax=Nocardioides sp. CER19 TaxID=3038538 RepID=UPI00244A109B|nr:ferritin-like domain-containing protein [Nocardioides sp. CER19]MDH2416837.1 ferritin-like domain-containing protein [Nocardioides sp. CER19]
MSASVQPLQTALAAEHAAVYVYGLLGGRTSRADAPQLYDAVRSAYESHRSRRDRLQSLIADAGADPVGPAAAYEAPAGIDSTRGIRRAALELQRSCVETYAWVVSKTDGEARSWAINALKDGAVRELTFRGTPETFPGIRELTDHS